MSPDVVASIKARLLNKAHERGEELQLYLVRYACERFLYRLGKSEARDRCVLKGAGLLTIWMDDPYRSTRDVDLLAFGPSDEASIVALMRTICHVPCPEDGLRFDVESINVSPIRAQEEYQGQRVSLRASLGKARIRLQVDIGFGDLVSPGPEESGYPSLLAGLPSPLLRTYPRVVSIAEKFEAMVRLGRRNSRMKDFHDIWELSSRFEFSGAALRRAVAACFEQRGMIWSPEGPEVLGSAFYGLPELDTLWANYLRAGAYRTPPPASFEAVGARVRAFLGPVRDSILADQPFQPSWPPGGPWR